MIASPSLSFDDYVDALQSATVFYLKTGPTLAHWDLALYPINRTTVQFGTDGSARIVHGVTSPDAPVFIMQRTKISRRVFLDGQMLQWHDIAIFPPSCLFTFVCDVPVDWVSLSAPMELVDSSHVPRFEKHRNASMQTQKKVVTLSETSANKFVKATSDLRLSVQKSGGLKKRFDEPVAEKLLLSTLDEALSDSVSERHLPGGHTKSAEETVFKALTYVQSNASKQIHIDDLVRVTGVEYRTLLRAFQRYLKIGPKRYLKLRQLNLVRRALRQKRQPAANVINILVDHGVNEFGRFATEYRHLFGETPSETLRGR